MINIPKIDKSLVATCTLILFVLFVVGVIFYVLFDHGQFSDFLIAICATSMGALCVYFFQRNVAYNEKENSYEAKIKSAINSLNSNLENFLLCKKNLIIPYKDRKIRFLEIPDDTLNLYSMDFDEGAIEAIEKRGDQQKAYNVSQAHKHYSKTVDAFKYRKKVYLEVCGILGGKENIGDAVEDFSNILEVFRRLRASKLYELYCATEEFLKMLDDSISRLDTALDCLNELLKEPLASTVLLSKRDRQCLLEPVPKPLIEGKEDLYARIGYESEDY